MRKVRKAIIPEARLKNRFCLATKAMPKEKLPIVDKTTIQHIVNEDSRDEILQLMYKLTQQQEASNVSCY